MNDLLKEWYWNLPANQQTHARKLIMELCGWTYDVFFNKVNGRTAISRSEMRLINQVANERVFSVPEVK